MTPKQARALYSRGMEATVEVLVELSSEVQRLRERVEELEKLVAKTEVNPTTPSGAIPPYEKENVNQAKGKRRKKPGRKPGHPGSGRKRPERIDDTQEHRLDACPHCQGPVHELPRPRSRIIEGLVSLMSRVVEHLIFRYYCPGCKKMVEPKVLDALPKGQVTLYSIVLGAWLHFHVGMSLSNLVKLFNLCGLRITAGGLCQAWSKLAELLAPVYDQILDKVKRSAVLHADETGWRVNGVTYWLWYFGTKLWSYYVVDRHRSTKVVDRVLGQMLQGILICDFWGAYNALKAVAKQRCIYHLFTELAKVDKRNHSAGWADFRKKLYRLVRDAIRLVMRHARLDDQTYARRKALILARLDALLAAPADDKDVRRLCKRLRRHRNELFVFVEHPETVSPYNNHGEQEMRKPVMTRRISHGNRSQRGAQIHAILMSLFRSMELHGLDPIKSVVLLAQEAIAGRKPSVDKVLSSRPRDESETTAQSDPDASVAPAEAYPDTTTRSEPSRSPSGSATYPVLSKQPMNGPGPDPP